jgi:hypothetical protein
MEAGAIGIDLWCVKLQCLSMLSPQERHLLVGILLVLMLGGVVKSCRSRVTAAEVPKEVLPSLDAPAKPEPPPD